MQAVLTSLLTIFCGVFVFVLSQYFLEIVLKPYIAYKKLKGKILYNLVYYGNVYTNPLKKDSPESVVTLYNKAHEEFRCLSAELKGFIEEIPRIKLFIPSKRKLIEVADNLLCISNGLDSPDDAKDNRTLRDNIKKGLSFSSSIT